MKKKCAKCKKTKDFLEFHKDKNRKDGYNHYCKSCVKKKRTSKIKKTCHICKEEKLISDFYSQTNRCKSCDKEKSKNKKAKSTDNLDKLISALDATRTTILRNKECDTCHKTKEIEDFPRNIKNIDGCKTTCHRCQNKRRAGDMTTREIKFDGGVDTMELMYINILEELKSKKTKEKS